MGKGSAILTELLVSLVLGPVVRWPLLAHHRDVGEPGVYELALVLQRRIDGPPDAGEAGTKEIIPALERHVVGEGAVVGEHGVKDVLELYDASWVEVALRKLLDAEDPPYYSIECRLLVEGDDARCTKHGVRYAVELTHSSA